MTSDTDKTFTFNLVSREWIRCRMTDDARRETKPFSLEEVLAQAHKIQEIVGDTPLVTIALHRLLLVILSRTLERNEWQPTHARGSFETEQISKYLREGDIYSRFDLFDAKHPFYQTLEVPEPLIGNEPGKDGKIDSAAKLLFQMDNNATLFEHYMLREPPELSPALATRLLIAFQSFHFSGFVGANKKEVGEDRANVGASPLVNCAIGLARGKNLFETLMLNLYLVDKQPHNKLTDRKREDKPIWEIDPQKTFQGIRVGKAKHLTRTPHGYLDLATWQSRRIRLKPTKNDKGETVVRYAKIWDGLHVSRDYQRQNTETMVGFRKLLKVSRKTSDDEGDGNVPNASGWMPMNIEEDRALWRDSYSLFHSYKDADKENERPLILRRLSNLERAGVLPAIKEIPIDFFCAKAIKGGLLWWRHERLPLPLSFLSDDDGSLSEELNKALKLSESVAITLRDSVRRLAVLLLLPYCDSKNPDYFLPRGQFKPPETRSARRESAKKKQTGIETKINKDKPAEINARVRSFAPELRYWSRLENEFRRMIVDLARARRDAGTMGNWHIETREGWAKALKRVARQAFDEIGGGIGANARNLRAAAIAAAWFNAELASQSYKHSKRDRDESDSSDTGEADDANAEGDDE